MAGLYRSAFFLPFPGKSSQETHYSNSSPALSVVRLNYFKISIRLDEKLKGKKTNLGKTSVFRENSSFHATKVILFKMHRCAILSPVIIHSGVATRSFLSGARCHRHGSLLELNS
jgi:hypothetical protein